MNKSNNQAQKFDPYELNAYQMGQQLAAQLFTRNDQALRVNRQMMVIRREAQIINGEVYVTETELHMNEDEATPYWQDQERTQLAPPPTSWINKILGQLS